MVSRGRKRTHTLIEKSRARSSRCCGLSLWSFWIGWGGGSTSHRTWVLFVLLPSGQVCPVEETNQMSRKNKKFRDLHQKVLATRSKNSLSKFLENPLLLVDKQVMHIYIKIALSKQNGLMQHPNALLIFWMEQTYSMLSIISNATLENIKLNGQCL